MRSSSSVKPEGFRSWILTKQYCDAIMLRPTLYCNKTILRKLHYSTVQAFAGIGVKSDRCEIWNAIMHCKSETAAFQYQFIQSLMYGMQFMVFGILGWRFTIGYNDSLIFKILFGFLLLVKIIIQDLSLVFCFWERLFFFIFRISIWPFVIG